MRLPLLALLMSPALGLGACMTASEAGVFGMSGRADLVGPAGAQVGAVTLRQGEMGVVLRVEARGLTPGWHGMHLHAQGRCDGPGFQSAGAHLHPNSAAEAPVHGLLNPAGPEWGDLPNLYAHADGTASAEFNLAFALLSDETDQGLLDADGTALVIHAAEDDHESQPIGGSGARVACGVVRVVSAAM